MKKTVSFFLFLVLLCNPALLLAQTEPESIVPETDKFEDYFYESLKQKGIENYDKAIEALEECSKIKPNDATVYFELGKNYLASKDYEHAYKSFEKATQIDPKNKWFWLGIYDVNYQTNNYNQAISTVNKLIEFDEVYKEDLISLYMNTQQFDKALVLINDLNDKVGRSDRRDSYKTQILSQGKYQNVELDTIVSKFKYYLDNNQGPKAINSMNVILASSSIDSKIKHRVLNEFLIFVNTNPQYAPDLEKAIAYFENDPDVNVAKEIGKYYHNKKQWDKAIQYYELALKNNSGEDIETNLLLLQTYVETKQFELVAKKATAFVEIFPTQPQFYYFSGLANNQLKQFKKAKETLETGLDYLVEDELLEINLNIQLGDAYNGLGDFKKKELYFSKANQLLKDKK